MSSTWGKNPNENWQLVYIVLLQAGVVGYN